MAKWFGKIGYAITAETEPGIWEPTIVEREAYGDVRSDRYKRQNSGINDKVILADTISIVADPFVYQNCSCIAYVEYMGAKWKVSDIDASQRPRLILTMGEVYNGEQA